MSSKEEEIFAIVSPLVTKTIGITNTYDLVILSYIHSITKDGQSGKRMYMTPKELADTWFPGEYAERSVKDAIKGLLQANLIIKDQVTIHGRRRNAYYSNVQATLDRISTGEISNVQTPKKRRNRTQVKGGTVPPHNGGTVPVVPYTHKNAIVPPLSSGTVTPSLGGTVPLDDIYSIKAMKAKLFFLKGSIELNSKEEEMAIYMILFFRNLIDPRGSMKRFYEYNVRNGWNNGRLDTVEKRLIVAYQHWDCEKKEKRCDDSFLIALRNIYNVAYTKGDSSAALILDPKLHSEVRKNQNEDAIFIFCSNSEQREWFQSRPYALQIIETYSHPLKVYYVIDKDKTKHAHHRRSD